MLISDHDRREDIRQSLKQCSFRISIQELIILIYTFLYRQLRFLGHLLRSDDAFYAHYEHTHGKTRRGRPRINYITYVQKIAGHQLSKLNELA